MTHTRTSRAALGALTGIVQYGVKMLFQLLMAPVLLRLAGAETLGAYALLVQIIGYLGLLDLGFSYALTRYAAQSYGIDDQGENLRQVLTIGRSFLLGTNLLMALATLLVALFAGRLFQISPAIEVQMRLGLLILACWTLLRTQFSVYPVALVATQHMAERNLIATLANVLRLAVSLLLVFSGLGLIGLMLGNLTAEMFDLVASRWLFARRYPDRALGWGIPRYDLLKQMFRFGNQAMLITVSQRMIFYSDSLIVGWLFGAVKAGVYYSTQMPVLIGWTVILELSVNAAAAVNELYARKEWESLRQNFLRLQRYNLLAALPFSVGVVVFLQDLVRLWVGESQFAGQSMAVALGLFALIVPLSHLNTIYATARGGIRVLSLWSFCEGIANVVVSIILGANLGLPGVMWATVLTNLPKSIYLHLSMQRQLEISSRQFAAQSLLPVLPPVLVSATAGVLLRQVYYPYTWGDMVVIAALFGSVYFLMSWVFGLLPEERLMAKGIFLRVFSAVGRRLSIISMHSRQNG